MSYARGLFGPDSVSWRVIGHPAALVGGLRALLLQALHPLAMAGVAQHSNYLEDPMGRLRRTASYVSTVTFGTHAEAEAAAAVVRGVHKHVHGTDPVTGRRYSASDPATMVWVHCVEVHSFLAAYRAYARPISRADQDRYLAEQVEAAVLLGTPRAPRARLGRRLPRLLRLRARRAVHLARGRGRHRLRAPALAARPARRPAAAAPARVPRHGRRRHLAGALVAARAGRAARRGPRELPSRVAVTTASNAVAVGLRIPVLRHAVEEPLTRTLGTKRRPRVPGRRLTVSPRRPEG